MTERENRERGALIVEATIVFPIMFLVVFLMLFTGNAYLQKCKVDSYVTQLALEGAAYCADPLLEYAEDGKLPSVATSNVYPYRYFDPNGVGNIEDELESKIEKQILNMGTGLFPKMSPQNTSVDAEYNNGFIYSTFSVSASYKIVMPIRMLGTTKPIIMNLSSYANMPVSDTTEFIRNFEMVNDYMEKTGAKEKIENAVEGAKTSLNDALAAAKKWFNP